MTSSPRGEYLRWRRFLDVAAGALWRFYSTFRARAAGVRRRKCGRALCSATKSLRSTHGVVDRRRLADVRLQPSALELQSVRNYAHAGDRRRSDAQIFISIARQAYEYAADRRNEREASVGRTHDTGIRRRRRRKSVRDRRLDRHGGMV